MTVSYQRTPFDGPWMQPLKDAVWGRCHGDFNSPLLSPRSLSWLCHHLICLCLLFPSVVGWRCIMRLDYMIGPLRSNSSNRIVWWGWGKETTFVIEYFELSNGPKRNEISRLEESFRPWLLFLITVWFTNGLRHPLRLSVKHQITYSRSLIDRLPPPSPMWVSLNLFDLVQIYTLVSTTWQWFCSSLSTDESLWTRQVRHAHAPLSSRYEHHQHFKDLYLTTPVV